MNRLIGKIAIVTGAAQGIGALMAKALADEGAKVLVTDVQDTAAAVKAITDAGGTAIGMKVDVTNNADLAAMVKTATTELGGIDIMVNNASIFATLKPKPFFEIDDDEFDLIMRVNTRGVHQVMRAITPTMIKAGGGKVRVVAETPPKQEAEPVFADLEVARVIGTGADEFAPHDVAVRAQIISGGKVGTREVFHEGANVSRVCPAKVNVIVVAEIPPTLDAIFL